MNMISYHGLLIVDNIGNVYYVVTYIFSLLYLWLGRAWLQVAYRDGEACIVMWPQGLPLPIHWGALFAQEGEEGSRCFACIPQRCFSERFTLMPLRWSVPLAHVCHLLGLWSFQGLSTGQRRVSTLFPFTLGDTASQVSQRQPSNRLDQTIYWITQI